MGPLSSVSLSNDWQRANSSLPPISIYHHHHPKQENTPLSLPWKVGAYNIRSLQQILGHESIATTEIYTHIDEAQLQAAVNANPLAMMFS
jgi:integrase